MNFSKSTVLRNEYGACPYRSFFNSAKSVSCNQREGDAKQKVADTDNNSGFGIKDATEQGFKHM